MRSNFFPLESAETRVCSSCGYNGATVRYENESFPYGEGQNQIMLGARVPVIHCEQCGLDLTDEAAEEIRHAEICRHLGRLAPREVRKIREQYGLSQQEWAERTKLGLASVKRWETGSLIQSEAMDCYLRLLTNPLNLARVASVTSLSHDGAFKFRTELPVAASEAALVFELRKAS